MMYKSLDDQRKQLPVYASRQHLLTQIKQHNTLILLGETGSGKTTQTPQFLYENGLVEKGGMIGITQPRRVAAISVATRVSQEKKCRLGELVGYSVRFDNMATDRTKIKFMTDGILLREALSDPLLTNYRVIILDEAHERTINTDVLFGIVKEAQKMRKDQSLIPLKIIIMSATMDVDHFAQYFNDCPVLYLPGRTFTVNVMHAKIPQSDYQFAALVTLFEIHKKAPANHDVLIFLTGKDEIESMTRQIRTIAKSNELRMQPQLKVFPLYSTLSQKQQADVFLDLGPGQRKVIVATNIAETSITISGIKYVIDTGVVKVRNFDPMTRMESLKVAKISQAQAWQRTGRAGRESEGTCYRTYTENEYDLWDKMTKPEILRCNLSNAIIQLLALGINVQDFDFIDAPPPQSMEAAFRDLKSLGALKNIQSPQLTELGRRMAKFPLDPVYSKIILSAPKYECLNEILDLVSVLSSESVFCDSIDKKDVALAQHAKLQSKYGDHLTLLNVFRLYQKQERQKTWCTEFFLNNRNLAYAESVKLQLTEICHKDPLLKVSLTSTASAASSLQSNVDQIRKCLISGLFNNIAELQPRDNSYLTLANRQRAQIHPTSVLSAYNGNLNGSSVGNGNGSGNGNGNGNGIIAVAGGSGSSSKNNHVRENVRPGYVLYSEIVQTTQTYLRTVTKIDPEWISEAAPECGYLNRLNTSTSNNNHL